MNENQPYDEEEIDLREIFFVLKKRILVILLAGIICAGGAGVVTKFLITPIYSSTAQLYVASSSTLTSLTDLQIGTQLTQDYMVLVKTRPVINQVKKNLKLEGSYKALVSKVTVENPTDTRILQISVNDPDPYVAQKMAQELAKVTAQTVAKKMDVKAPSVLEDAYLPQAPDSPSLMKNTAMGGLVGLFLAAFIVILLHILNDTICTEDDIEKYLGLNTLASVPLDKDEEKEQHKKKKRFGKAGA